MYLRCKWKRISFAPFCFPRSRPTFRGSASRVHCGGSPVAGCGPAKRRCGHRVCGGLGGDRSVGGEHRTVYRAPCGERERGGLVKVRRRR